MSSQKAFRHERRVTLTRRFRASAKRGELLSFDSHAPVFAPTRSTIAPEHSIVITHGGREFEVTPEMAECFLSHARRVLTAGDAQMVALLHREGIEMLFIARNIPFTVGDLFNHQPE